MKLKQSLRRWVPTIATFVGMWAAASALIMLLWNNFMVPATDLATISYGTGMVGAVGILCLVLFISGCRAAIDFILIQTMATLTRRKMERQLGDYKSLIDEHFGGQGFPNPFQTPNEDKDTKE